MARKVAIVAAGEWRKASRAKGEYSGFEETLQGTLERAEVRVSWPSKAREKAADVKVVASIEEARAWIEGERGTMVFTTRGMLSEADKLARELFSRVRIVLLTGEVPEDRPIVIGKHWRIHSQALCGIILDRTLIDPSLDP